MTPTPDPSPPTTPTTPTHRTSISTTTTISISTLNSTHSKTPITAIPSSPAASAPSIPPLPDDKVELEEFTEPKSSPTLPPSERKILSWTKPHDPDNPLDFSTRRKWAITLITGLMTFCVSFASSVFSTAVVVTAERFETSVEVMILGVSLYVLGFAFGPLIFAPLSEIFGRRPPLLIGFTLFTLFNIPYALAPNLPILLLARFLTGLFGSAPLAIVGGIYVDIWPAMQRGFATVIFAAATFMGPCAGPIAGEFIVKSRLGWRWTGWITLIVSGVMLVVGYFGVPETLVEVLLQRKAREMREEGKGDWWSKRDEEGVELWGLVEKYGSRPLVMLFTEPILLYLILYLSLAYSILYLIFFAYPYSFHVVLHWETGVSSLPFLSILIGLLLACLILTIYYATYFRKVLILSKRPLLPEARLPPMILGSLLLPSGLFFFAWTSSPSITWIPQVLSGILIGIGIFLVFLPGLTYIVDAYLTNANSALAAAGFARAAMAAGFPMFSLYMYRGLGVQWATSTLGFVCLAMVPGPVVFWVWGKKLRAKGR